ncbi:MAG: GNAT family N-acetyltransferase [Methanomicrobiaceae archaeon]|nr:GNAT family N-acetyltransferase [Methanomicrobiaceae archaeon]
MNPYLFIRSTMEQLIIEHVDAGNIREFISLIEKLAEYERLTPPDDRAKERLVQHGLSESPHYEAYIGRIEGIAVAYVTIFFTYSTFNARPTLFLEDIFVLEEYRNRGIGRAMFDLCRRRAQERGCGRMEWMVLTWNEHAIRFYEKCGAERLDWFVYRLEDPTF